MPLNKPNLGYPNLGLIVGEMAKSIHTDQYATFRSILIAERRKAELSQQALADKLGKPQSFVSKIEMGERRLDVIEFLELMSAIGSDPSVILKQLQRTQRAASFKTRRTRPKN
jgi:transcriptional regulator with XRE-family HTH domain